MEHSIGSNPVRCNHDECKHFPRLSESEGTIDPFVRIIRTQEQLKLSRSTSESFVSANASQVNNA